MKNTSLVLIIALCSLYSTVNAQYGCNCKKTKVLQEFNKAKKLIVQLSGDAAYDTALVRAVEAGWKLSPYEFADAEKVKGKMLSAGYSFLVSQCIYQITLVDGRPSVKRPNNQLMVVCGGKSTFDDENTVAFSTFDRQIPFTKDFRYEEDLRKMMLQNKFRLMDAVAGINDAIEFMQNDEKGPLGSCLYGVNYMNDNLYNKRLPSIKTKTLYIKTSDVKRGAEKLPKVYPYKYKLVSDAEYKKAIEESRADVVYVYINQAQWGGIVIVDAAEHKCVGGIHYAGLMDLDDRHIGDIAKEIKKAEKANK